MSSSHGESLASKRCIPCEGGNIEVLNRSAADDLLSQLAAEWEVREDAAGLSLHRHWKTKNFLSALELCRRFGDVAESEGHHPDLHVTGWNNLEVAVSTHSVGGLTLNDFVLAAKLDNVDTKGFLRGKKKTLAES
jgi:4a-hydroxytetrahydrobiopterin dehydratase